MSPRRSGTNLARFRSGARPLVSNPQVWTVTIAAAVLLVGCRGQTSSGDEPVGPATLGSAPPVGDSGAHPVEGRFSLHIHDEIEQVFDYAIKGPDLDLRLWAFGLDG